MLSGPEYFLARRHPRMPRPSSTRPSTHEIRSDGCVDQLRDLVTAGQGSTLYVGVIGSFGKISCKKVIGKEVLSPSDDTRRANYF
jgi:hypothetical protein